MANSFIYDPIKPKYIRLFKLNLSAPSKSISGKIIVFRHPCHHDFTSENIVGAYKSWNDLRFTERKGDVYGYDALSYAWESSQENFPLTLQLT